LRNDGWKGFSFADFAAAIFIADTGTYTFNAVEPVTRPDAASMPDLFVDQIRRIRFESTTLMVLKAISGVAGQGGTACYGNLKF
jgi:hypothetical protein